MKRITILLSALFLFAGVALAQSSYKIHTIKEGETLSQLAKKYGTSVGDIMRLNKMTTSSKLLIGEKVKIPAEHADAPSKIVADIPDTHTVAKGETLYQISHKYDVSVTDLRDWNNIADNTIQVGQILKLKKTAVIPDNVPAKNNDDSINPQEENNAVQVEADNTVDASNSEKQRATSVFDQTPVKSVVTDEGLYANLYKSQANGTELITKGSSGIFKTASGWQDKKYFILMNEVNPGTVVKVQANGKTIYAKVLWNLGNVKENEGLSYRVSDAAASVLGVSGDKFDLIVSYFK